MSDEIQLGPNLGEIIATMSNESRLRILLELGIESQTVSTIAKKLDLNLQDTHRNVARMIQNNILFKNDSGLLHPSSLGIFMIHTFPSMNFVVGNASYFQNHSFGKIHEKYVQRIGAVGGSELIVGVVKVLERWVQMAKNSKKIIKILTNQAPLESVKETLHKASQGQKVNLIIAKDSIFPDRLPDLLKEYNIGKLELNGYFEVKVVHAAPVCLVVSEDEASVSFPTLEGEIDMNMTFFGKNPEFLEWCNDLFEEFWEDATPSTTSILTN